MEAHIGRSGALLMALGAGDAAANASSVPCPSGVGDAAALIAAINLANDETATPGADTITLVSGCTFTLTAADNTDFILGATGLPIITSEITIQGNGSTITRDSTAPEFRIIAIFGGNRNANLTIEDTTISGGITDDPTLGSDDDDGGGITNYYYGTVTLTGCTITGNTAASSGGGVYNGSGSTMTLTNSTVSGNSAVFGGGVYNDGTMTLTNSTVSGNSANRYGGVFNFRRMTLSRTLISGNTGGGAPEVFSFGISTINANDFNLFGFNNISGTNFTPGADDIVPAKGVMVSDILVVHRNDFDDLSF